MPTTLLTQRGPGYCRSFWRWIARLCEMRVSACTTRRKVARLVLWHVFLCRTPLLPLPSESLGIGMPLSEGCA